jgi:hypothetical protein
MLVLHPVLDGNSPLEELEQKWFAPMLSAVRGRQLAMLSVLVQRGDDTLRFDVSAGDLWKFWRRAPLLAH